MIGGKAVARRVRRLGDRAVVVTEDEQQSTASKDRQWRLRRLTSDASDR